MKEVYPDQNRKEIIRYKSYLIFLIYSILFSFLSLTTHSRNQSITTDRNITHNISFKTIQISDPEENLILIIDYSEGCKIKQLKIKGDNILSPSGVFTGFRTKGNNFTSGLLSNKIEIEELTNGIRLKQIAYGDQALSVNEIWDFTLLNNKIRWSIEREYCNTGKLEEIAFPQWSFTDLSVWKGGILDNGGMVWCKYLANINDTYGVHTGGVTFWEPTSGNGLRIIGKPANTNFIATKYSHSEQNEFTCTQFVTEMELEPRYHLNRFVHQRADVFSSFNVQKGKTGISLDIEYIDYTKKYSRGTLPGIDADAVRELLNTTGRYGVVDNTIVGANGWITNWKCLHEPFFAQIGMALNDENYIRNMSATLDQERDFAMLPDGRVLSRWHNADEDQMPGTFNYKTGYYEAKWGYTVDSQTGYIINTAEQFDLCGDIEWLSTHKASCEKALDWLIRRDSNNNGIFEMVNSYISEEKASDWLDIVWAGFENAFVNAQLYEALKLWANCELVLGDKEKSDYYFSVASRLKENFNKPIEEGGFWSAGKKQYVYWRDKDGSIHGDNLVTPVNFAVIAFGLCDNKDRIAMILDQIEERTASENLFHWPLCFDSFKREEVSPGNWPFPTYENGDIFPTWGYMGVRAYAGYNKKIALKYICNLLEQYKKDGLSSQRYSRTTQQGLGSDILAGICTSITALYRDIYGIRPKWNRMGLEPNMSESLNGTEFSYTLRGITYHIRLSVDDYILTTEEFGIKSKNSFGINKTGNQLIYYPENREETTLMIESSSKNPIYLETSDWKEMAYTWKVTSPDKYHFRLTGLIPGGKYTLMINNKSGKITAGKDGSISFKNTSQSPTIYLVKAL